MTSDGVSILCSLIERTFGYGRRVEAVCAAMTWVAHRTALDHLRSDPARLVIVTAWMPSYLENIYEVLLRLKQDGMQVVIFPEWRRSQEPEYNQELGKYVDFEIFFDQHRALPRLDADIFLSSTATKHSYFSRGSRRFFYFHSVSGLDGFPEGGLDDYTHFLCATDQQYSQLKQRFDSLGLRKTLLAAGYPKFDRIVDRIQTSRPQASATHANWTVLLAPSYASDNVYANVSLLPQLGEVIEALLNEGYRVIFRPHPVSLRRGTFVEHIIKVQARYSGSSRFEFDTSQDYFDNYCRAHAMLTDVSGTAMIFRLAFHKPVVFFTPEPKKAVAAFSSLPQLGPVTSSVTRLASMLASVATTPHELPPPNIYNRGNSAHTIYSMLRDAR